MNWMPAFKYRFRDSLRGAAVFFAVMTLITLTVSIGVIIRWGDSVGSWNGSFSAFTGAGAIMLLVTGICTVREDLRLFIQHGISRRTAFAADLLAAAAICAVLAVTGDLLLTVSQGVTARVGNYVVVDIYQQLFMGSRPYEGLDLVNHLGNVLFSAAVFVMDYFLGAMISLVFFRLNKFWTVIVAVGAPVILLVGLPNFVPWDKIARIVWLEKAWGAIFSSAWGTTGFLAVLAAVFTALSWLLTRRAPIKPAAK